MEGAKPTLKISDSSSNFLLFIEDDSAMFVFVGTIVHWPFLMICLLLSQRCDQCTIAQSKNSTQKQLFKKVRESVSVVDFSLFIAAVINGQSNPMIKDVTEGSNVHLECRFSPELSRKASTLYWIRTNRKGHDNVAIGETPFSNNYK